MKSLFSLLALMVACSFSFATVRTVCNMPYSPGQYTDFTTAMNASQYYDTIYVQGSSITYGSIYISKPLVIIGTGHHPDKQNPLVSGFLTIQIGAPLIQLIGLQFNTLYSGNEYLNVTIKKCRILGSTSDNTLNVYYATNWLIEGNIFESPTSIGACINFASTPAINAIIRNNIFLSAANKIVRNNNSSTQRTYIWNNIFLGNSSSLRTFNQLSYTHIENNIFYSSIPDGNNSQLTNCLMNNNLSSACDDNFIYQPGANNLIGSPQFINYTGFQSVYNYDWDLSIDPASPGHNNGTDGTDLGVFGGLGFMFIETGEPSIAEITSFTITTPVIAPGGTLSISVTSKRVH